MNEACYYCGEPLVVDVLEIWGRDFMLETCCEGAHEAILDGLTFGTDEERAETRRWLASLLKPWTPTRQVYDHDGHVRIDHGLVLADLDFATAAAFVERHHRHHRAPVGWRWGHGVLNGPDLVGVAMVGRPVARAYDPAAIVEVNRLCTDPTVATALTWCAASMLYAAAAREARRRGFSRIITYILETELGTSLRAAGWTFEARTKGGSWNRPSRPRVDSAPTVRKRRWGREL